MKTILVPTDFSKNADHALIYAAALASQVRAKLIIGHVINLPVRSVGSKAVIPRDVQLEKESQQELNKLYKKLQAEYGPELAVETVCQFGYFMATLNELVEAKTVDLVIMGTHGASNFLDNLIGSNTSLYVKVAICPVLAVPAQANFTGLKKITYASDFENDETVFLQQLFIIAELFQAEVSILNVQTVHELNIFADDYILRNIHRHFPDKRYSLATIKEEDVVEGLYRFVQDNNIDVLAISIHKRDFLEDLFHRSISKQLIFHATVPVLSLPENPYLIA